MLLFFAAAHSGAIAAVWVEAFQNAFGRIYKALLSSVTAFGSVSNMPGFPMFRYAF